MNEEWRFIYITKKYLNSSIKSSTLLSIFLMILKCVNLL